MYITHLTVSLQPCNLLTLENNFVSLTSHKPSFVPTQMYLLLIYLPEVLWNINLLERLLQLKHI